MKPSLLNFQAILCNPTTKKNIRITNRFNIKKSSTPVRMLAHSFFILKPLKRDSALSLSFSEVEVHLIKNKFGVTYIIEKEGLMISRSKEETPEINAFKEIALELNNII